MTTPNCLLDVAIQHHESLPGRIRAYLNERGIPDQIINSNILGWNGWRITIPIYNQQGEVVFFRLAKYPDDNRPAPKMRSSPGSSVELYGWDEVLKRPGEIIICEGEFDRLVLQSQGFAAVTSTAGAATFRPEWAKMISQIENVYICFDNDQAGANGAQVVALMIPHAKVVQWPEEIGEGGDVTDFFVRLKKGRENFLKVLQKAKPAPAIPARVRPDRKPQMQSLDSLLAQRLQRVKSELPIDQIISKYVQLRPSGKNLVGRCPFHDDRTPSFTVYLDSNTYHCFGCRAHGDAVAFVRAMENLSFAQAIDVLDNLTSRNAKRDQENCTNGKAA
jgi:DNA primase